MTLHTIIQRAAQQLSESGVAFGHGTDNAFDEAAWLVLWCLKLPLDSDLNGSVGEQAVSQELEQLVNALIQRRITERKPAAYLTQEAWLHGVPFFIDERSIVPRSLIADPIADGSLDYWLSDQTKRVLDLCTGNGSLAVLAALAWPEVEVDAVDISEDALAVAAVNVAKHALADRIRLIQSNALQGLSSENRYDLVLCNPPYVNSNSMAALPQEYQAEPNLALDGGSDGMDFIRPMLTQLPSFMNEGAVLVLEIGHERNFFEQAFPNLPAIWLETGGGHDQVLVLSREALLSLKP